MQCSRSTCRRSTWRTTGRASTDGGHAPHRPHRPACRIEPYLDQGGACGAAGPALAPASGLGEAPAVARRAASAGTQIQKAHAARGPVQRTAVFHRRRIIPLASAASMALHAVASHAIGYRRPLTQCPLARELAPARKTDRARTTPETLWPPPRGEPYGKVTKVESSREVTARGSGRWYHPYDVELATCSTTWTDSAGARTRTRVRYELLASVPQGSNQCCATGDPYTGTSRDFSTSEERLAFIGQSFSDLTLRDLDPPQRDTVAHPLADLVGQRLETVKFDLFIPTHELRWGHGFPELPHPGLRQGRHGLHRARRPRVPRSFLRAGRAGAGRGGRTARPRSRPYLHQRH